MKRVTDWIRIQVVQFLRIILVIGVAFVVLFAASMLILMGFIQPTGEYDGTE